MTFKPSYWPKTLLNNKNSRWLHPSEYAQMRQTLNYCVAKIGTKEIALRLGCRMSLVTEWVSQATRPNRANYNKLTEIAQELRGKIKENNEDNI